MKLYIYEDDRMPSGYGVTNNKSISVAEAPSEARPGDSPYVIATELADGSMGFQIDTVTRNAELAHAEQARADKAAKDALLKAKLDRLDFGKRVKAEIAIVNDTKPWDSATFIAYLTNPSVVQISALLGDGALETAMNTMQAADLSEYYTADEVNEFVFMINQYLMKEN